MTEFNATPTKARALAMKESSNVRGIDWYDYKQAIDWYDYKLN